MGKKPYEGYSVDSLWAGIRQADVNIKTFEDAIKQEREKQVEWKWMIDQINRKKEEKIAAEAANKIIRADIKRQNDAHEAKYKAMGLRSVQVEKKKEEDNGN